MKEMRDEPKAVRTREEIGTVVVQLCLIDGETPTNAHEEFAGQTRYRLALRDAS